MQYTDYYQLREPTKATDVVKVDDINYNSRKIDEIMHDTQISLADAYDSTRTSANPYNEGDVVMYELLMYKCKEDGVYGAWDASKWERTTAGANGSGGGGSSVVPNPQGSATDTLSKIEIDGTIYDIEGSGGGGGSVSITVDDLWTNDNSYGIGTYVLSEDIDDYDFIEIWYGVYSEYTGSPYLSESKMFSVDTLNELYSDNKSLLLTGYSNRAIYCSLNNTTLSITYSDSNTILKVRGIKLSGGGSSGGTSAEIIPITAGDGTTSRTFTFSKTPKFIKAYWEDTTLDGGWCADAEIAWGQPYANYKAHTRAVSITGLTGGLISLTYGQDGKSVTITSGNAFGAWNTANGSGYMFVDYGEGGGSSEDISDMTWTLLDSTTGTSSGVAIPSGTKYLVLTAELGGYVSMVAKESIATIEKLATVAGATFNQGYEYADIAGNHTTISMSVSSGDVTIKSGYNTVTAKVYAIS